jgi:hypothetical protein
MDACLLAEVVAETFSRLEIPVLICSGQNSSGTVKLIAPALPCTCLFDGVCGNFHPSL